VTFLVGTGAIAASFFTPVLAQALPTKPPTSEQRADAYYTEDQARRGRFLFDRNCAVCHSMDPALSTPQDLTSARPRTFAGKYLERKVFPGDTKWLFPSVFYLFKKAETMPPWDTESISPQVRADIIAYILQGNGYPAGARQLTSDSLAMKTMMLHESGFVKIFNERDLSQMKFLFGYNCRAAPEGCATSDPGTVFRVDNRVLVCRCQSHGLWYTEGKYLNFTLRFEYRFTRPSDWEGDDELYSASTGYWVFMNDYRVWPRAFEIEGNNRDVLEIFGAVRAGSSTYDMEAKRRAIKPLGEWNAVEIVSKDGQVTSSLNGVVLSTFSHDRTEAGHIAFQSQGGEVSWRNIRIRVE